jgi:hypothetical protein
MSLLFRRSITGFASRAARMWRAICDTECAKACKVDRELMTLRTDLTRHAGWSAGGME